MTSFLCQTIPPKYGVPAPAHRGHYGRRKAFTPVRIRPGRVAGGRSLLSALGRPQRTTNARWPAGRVTHGGGRGGEMSGVILAGA